MTNTNYRSNTEVAEIVAKGFTKAVNEFRENPSAFNYVQLDIAMLAYQSVQKRHSLYRQIALEAAYTCAPELVITAIHVAIKAAQAAEEKKAG